MASMICTEMSVNGAGTGTGLIEVTLTTRKVRVAGNFVCCGAAPGSMMEIHSVPLSATGSGLISSTIISVSVLRNLAEISLPKRTDTGYKPMRQSFIN